MTAGRKNTQNKSDWNTPRKIVDVVWQFFGEVFLDPCSNSGSIVGAVDELALPMDGLSIPWNYPNVYVNPPYGRDSKRCTTIKNWIEKAYLSNQKYAAEIIMLIPVATNTSHWKEFVFGKASICFLKDSRLKFRIGGSEENKGAPMAMSVIYYGNREKEFKNIFGEFGYVCK